MDQRNPEILKYDKQKEMSPRHINIKITQNERVNENLEERGKN